METGSFRHHDHQFEWTREEFGRWAGEMAIKYGYTVEMSGVGVLDGMTFDEEIGLECFIFDTIGFKDFLY